ncbi:MAG: hypothetical protein GYA72_02610 [Deltaproteobacteria bacterium]|jgi:hypothetical protein|nr:hypothetical protein [Deltaproteobacteria bacterium]
MASKIKELEDLITEKEAQLSRAERESNAWNSGKYKTSSNSPISKILVNSLRKEIADLYTKLNLAKSNT